MPREQTPLEEELCNDLDDNCDGVIEEEMEETDIVFIIDTSGSMMEEIAAVAQALTSFAVFNSDVETIQWSLVVGPMDTQGFQDGLMIQTNLTDFFTFMNAPLLANPQQQNTGLEMLYDAIYFIIQDLIPQGNEPQNYVAKNQLLWNNSVTSTPPIPAFNISWREDAHHVIVVFSDEAGQSFTVPQSLWIWLQMQQMLQMTLKYLFLALVIMELKTLGYLLLSQAGGSNFHKIM